VEPLFLKWDAEKFRLVLAASAAVDANRVCRLVVDDEPAGGVEWYKVLRL
jgi:hypothetical protein